MKKEEKVDFDLSALTLKDLITVYNTVTEFIEYLDENKIEEEESIDDE